jgi:rubrerythrin
MEQLDFALQMERDGLKFFTEAAQAVQDSAAKKMLQSLAKDEERHEQILLDLKEGKMGQVQGETLEGVQTIFQDLVDAGNTLFKEEDSLSEVLKKGAELERRAIGVYRQLSESTDNPEVQKVWETLKREEKRHEKLLRLTLEYVDQPEVVLENAEFLFHGHEEAP